MSVLFFSLQYILIDGGSEYHLHFLTYIFKDYLSHIKAK